jgi:hypothetical protein
MVLSSLPLGCQSGTAKSPVAEDGRVYLPNETEEELRKCATLVQKDAWPTQRSVDANVKFDEDGHVLEATTTSEPNPDVGQCIRVALKEMRVDKDVLANAALRKMRTTAQNTERAPSGEFVGQVETVTVTVVTVVFVEVIVIEEVMVILGVSVTGSLVLSAMNGATPTVRQEAVTRGTRKPHQPNAKKWMDKGGSIDEKADGTTTYTRSDGVKVTYDKEGFPDFTPHRHPTVKDVQIEFSGTRDKDNKAADKAAGITEKKRQDDGYSWHHHQDGKTMQLIKEDVHLEFFHTGGMARVRKEYGKCE